MWDPLSLQAVAAISASTGAISMYLLGYIHAESKKVSKQLEAVVAAIDADRKSTREAIFHLVSEVKALQPPQPSPLDRLP